MRRFIALLLFLWFGSVLACTAQDRFKGRVVNVQTSRGVENLLVVLVPPASASTPRRSALTDYSGNFYFDALTPGRYLLEVSEGPYLLYRRVIDTTSDPDITVRLEQNENRSSVLAVAKHGFGVGGQSTVKESTNSSISTVPKVPTFQIKFEHQVDKSFNNLHTVVVYKVAGDMGFDSNPNRMYVELFPPGVTDLKVVDANEQQMNLHFVAAADYQPMKVAVTVYDSSNLDTRQPKAIAQPASTTAAADHNQPNISRTDTVFLQRSQGNGRMRIYGSGFSQESGPGFGAPPFSVDDYLLNCLQREDISPRNPLGQPGRGPEKRLGCHRLTGDDDDFQNPQSRWRVWRDDIRKRITVTLIPRNTDMRIERVEIIDINDSYIDTYFEFTRFPGYSLPFRLRGVTVIVQNTDQLAQPQLHASSVAITTVTSTPKTYWAYQDMGKASSLSLTYRYTVLDKGFVNTLLGKGIAENFYVLQVAMVNSGTKKVMVPLAAIQAEVEWARGSKEPHSDNGNDQKYRGNKDAAPSSEGNEGGHERQNTGYMEGPPTVAPARLATVSAHFDAFQKTKGRRAVMFNILDGLTTFGAALVPFAGPSLQDAHTVVSGGFIPGLHKAMGDLSSQQLQNLTALSWQDIESIAPGGGSIEKLVYIQRNAQFAGQSVTVYGISKKTEKQITNLLDLEITGYEVNETAGQEATSTSASQTPPQGAETSGKAP